MRDLPPGAATIGEALVNPIPIRLLFAICSVKYPSDVQVCACPIAKEQMPFFNAASRAGTMPFWNAGWANPNLASTRTIPAFS